MASVVPSKRGVWHAADSLYFRRINKLLVAVMPYASSVQVVNDANGVAHAFLADNGAIWQCQWDAQAQVWNQGQIVPQAFGGEKLQALYLDQLWPAGSGGTKGFKPGIVLAYRVGEGSNAEIMASFGQWDGSGQLGWSAPVQLTQDQLDEVAFSLVPAAGSVAGFSLVVQKRQADTPAATLLDQLGASSGQELSAKLEASLAGSRPDSDLYVTKFSLAASTSPAGGVVLSVPGTAFSAPITAAPAATITAAAPLPLAGNTQLSRQQLTPTTPQQPSSPQASPSSAAPSEGVNNQQTGNYSGPVAASFSKGGQWRTGMISASNLTRWEIQVPSGHHHATGNKHGDAIAHGTASNLDVGSKHFGPQLRWEGSFGIRNIGAGLTSLNTMKLSAGVGNDNEHHNSLRSKALAEADGGSDVTGYIGLGGMLVSQYSYQGSSGGLKANISLNPSQKLQQILTQESVGIDAMLRFRYIAPGGNSIKLTASNFIGYMWSQQVTNQEDIPSWIADLGYYSGMVGNVEKMGKAAYGVAGFLGKGGKSLAYKVVLGSWYPGTPKTSGEKAAGEENSGIGDQSKKGFKILNWFNAIYGTALAVTTPVALQSIKGLDTENSSGIQNETELVLRALYHSVIGIEIKTENKLEKYLKGAEKGSLEDKLYVAAGAALPLGGFLPLISYYHSFSSGAHSSETENYSSADGVYPSSSSSEAAPTSQTVYNGGQSGSAYPYTYTPASANTIDLGTNDPSSQAIPVATPVGVAGLGGSATSGAWTSLGNQSSPAAPALARIGNTVYIAVQGNSDHYIHWNSSSDGGVTWSTWQQLPAGMTTVLPPSLAVVGGTLYLSYLGDGNNEINITSLVNASANTWTNQYVIPGQSATFASVVAESVGDAQNLSVYYVTNNSADQLLRTTTATPASPNGWSSPVQITYNNQYGVQTASGPLAVTTYNGQTYIAYQGGTTTSPSNVIYVTSSAGSSSAAGGVYYPVQATFAATQGSGVGLTSSANGLLLGYGSTSEPSALQLKQLSQQADKWVVTDSYVKPLSTGLGTSISMLSLGGANGPGLLLADVNTAASGSGVATSLLALKDIQSASLKTYTLSPYALGLNPASASPSSNLPLTLVNAGSGLNDGSYSDVAILGVTISGGLKDAALASFTVAGGSIIPDSFKITRAGSYLALPDASQASTPSYALLLDVFTTGIANPPKSTDSAIANPFANLPLITVASNASASPLTIQSIQSIQTISVSPANQSVAVVYPQYDPKNGSTQPQPANNNATYVYSDVGVSLLNGATQQVINPLNADVTATVYLNAGVIQRVELSQPLLFVADTGSAANSPSNFTISLQLPGPVVNALPANMPAPSYAVSPQSLALNNFVEDEQFSGQSGAVNSGVYLSAGLSDQLPLYASMGAWPVQNRVTYAASSANGSTTPVYLNGLIKSAAGGYTPQAATTAAALSLAEIYTNQTIAFTAASNPTAATIAGPASSAYANKPFVAWVEASKPVIPITSASGADNFQAYMEAFYGDQRINYRINTGGNNWIAPDLASLYHPTGAMISHLQAVNVADPAAGGQERTLLVWSEVSIAAIKGEVQSFGSSGSSSTPIPSTLKVGWLNPNPKSDQWADLFADANGNSTIQTIPWTPTRDVGLGINEISIASMPLLAANAPNGPLVETPVISWSQDVRTPYSQSVLNDSPSIYLRFDQIQAGSSFINSGEVKDSSTTATFASDTGLSFTISGALPASQATAVQNSKGTGVLTTGMGSDNRAVSQILNNVPAGDLATLADPIALFTGSINSSTGSNGTTTTLTVTALTQGSLAVGDLISGPGIAAGTLITAVNDFDASSGAGSFTLNTSQTVASTAMIGTPNFGVCTFTASISGNELLVSSVTQGHLYVGDTISGPGIADGTVINAINNVNSNGIGSYSVNTSQTVSSSVLVSTPGLPTSPYTIEFWAQLQPGSNPQGAGLVALGQPSNGAIGAPSLPEGWLLSSSFVVDQITYNEAAARGLIASIPSSVSDPGEAVYGWGWAVLAEGADTTAMNGNGGSNLYSNAVQLNNLVSGSQLAGVSSFLQAYSLSSSDLIGLNGANAATIAQVPLSQLQFSNFIDPNTQQPNSSLSAIALDTSSAVLNQGMVLADATMSTSMQTMFNNLWQFQLKTGEAKVNFSLAPTSTPGVPSNGTPPSAQTSENYSGYPLAFSLARGAAVSVNGAGQIVFDVGSGTSLTAAQSGGTNDLRDGGWHYIVASYLPNYQTYNVEGNSTQLPGGIGTATVYIDNKLVASQSNVLSAYMPANFNDQALLLANNNQGAIDQLAFYDKALTSVDFKASTGGQWPAPTAADALSLLATTDYAIANKSTDLGTKPGAVSTHWLAHTVNPNDALLGTYYSTFSPDGNGGGSWTVASNLNPSPQVQATLPSAAPQKNLADQWQIAVPSSIFSTNIANDQLTGVTVNIVNKQDNSAATLSLSPAQVLLGGNSVQSLQPFATADNFHYRLLTDAPTFYLLISKDQLAAAGGSSSPTAYVADQYSVTYSFNFIDQTAGSQSQRFQVSSQNPVVLNQAASSILTSESITENQQKALQKHSQALATAAVIEQAPLQLKYVDSGAILKSSSSAAASSSASASPAPSFGTSQVVGNFTTTTKTTTSTTTITNGWLAIAQPQSMNATSNPAGRIWVQYTGQSTNGVPSATPAQAPSTWLNALAQSNFSADAPNLPLLGAASNASGSGGLLIQADPTVGWGENFGQSMLVADVNGDGTSDLVIACPQANGGGRVYIVDGRWISQNLTNPDGASILNLANPNGIGSYVTILTPSAATAPENSTVAGFGSALAFNSQSKTLWIGAPNYLSQLNSTDSTSLQPIGALYSYTASTQTWGTGAVTQLQNPILGSGGTATSLNLSGTSTTTYWGSQFGSAIAVDPASGAMAVSAPGVYAAMVYSGTQGVQQQVTNGSMKPSDPYGDGALIKIQLPGSGTLPNVSIADGPSASGLVDVVSQDKAAQKQNGTEESTYMQNLKALQVDTIAKATVYNNQALQVNAVGAVYLFNSPTAQPTPATASSTYYGPNPWNVLGPSGFGKSLAFGDLTNSNKSILSVGADQTGGSGAVYFIDPSAKPATSIGSNQYLAHLASGLTLYGAQSQDHFGSGLLNLGDVNDDSYSDLLIQAYNASGSAGNGYVLFGSDNLTGLAGTSDPGTGNVAKGSIGQIKRASGTGFTAPILSELGYGLSSNTGQGTFGQGDINGDGLQDIPLGSGPNGSAYLTWGHPYLEAINTLQLNKLASNTGYMLDGLATTTQGSLRSIGDFNGDGYGDFMSIQRGSTLTTVRIELGANTQEVLADYLYNDYFFTVSNDTQVSAAGDINGDGFSDLALLINQDLSPASQGAGSTLGILYGRSSNQLPVGSGFGYLAPVNPSSQPLMALPGLDVAGGLSDAQPAVISVGTSLYAVVKGDGATSLWFAQSSNGGQTWTNWTNLTASQSGLASNVAPSLAYFNNKLYLAFLNTASTPSLSLSSWDPNSNTPTAWSTPTALSDGTSASFFTSQFSPQLIDRGDALGVVWVDASTGTLSASYSLTPDQATALPGLAAPTAWSPVGTGSSPASPALARIGNTVYMAVQGNNSDHYIYWNSSSDGGVTWGSWQTLPTTMTSSKPPSLAVVGSTLYLSYLEDSNNAINITSLSNASTNQWATSYVIPGQSATYASLVAETAGSAPQLAVYYVSNDSTNRILKAYSTTPTVSTDWTADVQIQYNSLTGVQTASGPLAVTSYEGQTYIAYLGGTTTSPSNLIYLTSSAGSAGVAGASTASLYYPVQSSFTAASGSGLALTSGPNGLILGYGSTSAPNALQLKQLSQQAGNWVTTDAYSESLPSSLSNDVSILGLNGGNGPGLVLAGINTASNGYNVQTSLLYPVNSDSSWNSPRQLQERVVSNGTSTYQPIVATAAPSLTLLGQDPVLAVNRSGTVNVYAGMPNSLSWQLASSFTAASNLPQISTAPVLATTDTGLALTYGTSDGAINLNRLTLLNGQGALLADPQPWASTVLNQANGGLSSNLATVPVSVDGTLLLTNVRSTSNQIWLNAVPTQSDSTSSTWLNTTIQLPDGSISQQAGVYSTAPLSPAWPTLSFGGSPTPPAFTEANGVIYAAVQGTNKVIYWCSSANGGATWSAWTPAGANNGKNNDFSAFTTDQPPALAVVGSSLYLAYLGDGNTQINISSLALSNAQSSTAVWNNQYQIPNQGAYSLAMLNENGNLAIYYQGASDTIYRTASSDPSSSSSWSVNTVDYNNGAGYQTCSGQLAVTALGGTTYLAYQGGTTSSLSNTVYLTSSSSQATASSWSVISGVPQPSNSSHSGVGLATLNNSLVISYADQVGGSPVLAVQKGTVSSNAWAGMPYVNLVPPGGTTAPQASLFTPSGSSQVLMASINANSSQAICTTVVQPMPLVSSLSSVGDVNNDGYADLLLTAKNVVAATPSGSQLNTGLRLIRGAATSSQLATINSNAAASQTIQLAALETPGSGTPVSAITGANASTGTLNLSLGVARGTQVGSLTAVLPPTALTTTASSVSEASSLFAGIQPTLLSPAGVMGAGQPALNSTGTFGDLNGDGYLDYLAADGVNQIATARGGTISFSLWSIRAAGDVNGNGVDDVLLGLAPQGPAYVSNPDGSPSAITSVLVDGSLFKVDPTTNTFSLSNLRSPLDPYSKGEVYDVQSTSSSQYLPLLQNWFDPILSFQSGTLSGVGIGNAVGVGGAKTQAAPAALVDELGNASLLYAGYTSGSGVWMATLNNSTGTWTQYQLPSALNKIDYTTSPSAVFYQGNVYLAYIDDSNYLHIAFAKAPANGQLADLATATWTSYQVITTNASNQVDESSRYSPALAVEEGRLALYFASNDGSSSSNDNGVTQQLRYLYSNNPDANTPSWGISQASGSAPYVGESTTLNFVSKGTTDQYSISSGVSATTYQGKTVLAFTGNGGGSANNEYNIRLATAPSARPKPSDDWLYWSSGQSASYGYNSGSIGLTTDQSLLYVTPASGSQTSQVYGLSPQAGSPGNYILSNGFGGPGSLSNYGNPTIFMHQGLPMLAWANNSSNLQAAALTLTVGAPNQQSLAGYSLDGNIDVNGDGFTDILLSDPSDPGMGVDNQYVLFGGDYLNIASQVGTAGNDTLIGTPQADVIFTLAGADVVQSNGGADVIYTGSGDDQISIKDNAFLRIDAGSGFDQLLLQGQAGQAYDFTLNVDTPQYFAGTKLKGIELISSVDYGSNTLSFDAAAINAINPDRILFLTPDSADFITLSAEFERNQSFDTNYGGSLWYAYAAGGGAGGSTNPTLAYVRVPAGSAAATWLSSQVSVGAQTPAVLQSSRLADPTQAIEPIGATESIELIDATAANEPIEATEAIEPTTIPLDITGPYETTFLRDNVDPLASTPPQDGSDPVTTSFPSLTATDSSSVPAATQSMVAGRSDFGDGLTITAYRTTPTTGVACFRISRSEVSRSQLISYVSSSLNSSAEPGRHYTPVAGLLRLEKGQSFADISVPVDAAAMAALRNGSLSLQVGELEDLGQQQIHLLLSSDPANAGPKPVLSGLRLQVDPAGQTASIGFRADVNQPARAPGLASTLNLQLLRRQSADRAATDPTNRSQNLAISDGVDSKFDQDGLSNRQIALQLDLNTSNGAIALHPNANAQPLLLSKLDPKRRAVTVGIDLTTTTLDALTLATPPAGVVLNRTAVDFTVAADGSGRSKLFLDLTQVGDDLEISEVKDGVRKRRANHQLVYYGINTDGVLSPLTYNARYGAGARFYDTNGDGIADFVSLTFVDGGIGDTGPSNDGKIHDPSTAGVVSLPDIQLTLTDQTTLEVASKDNKDAKAALMLRATLSQRAGTANQIGYVVLDADEALDPKKVKAIFTDLSTLRSRAQTLFSSLQATDVTLAAGTSLEREILLINGQSVRFFEVVNSTLDDLKSANDPRLQIFTSTSSSDQPVAFTSLSGVRFSLALVDGDQGLNALIGQEQGLAPVLDFTGFSADQQVVGTLSLAREASFDAVTGFYRALDLKGTVWKDPADHSKGTLTPGEGGTTAAAYAAAALSNRVDALTGLEVGNRQTTSRSIALRETTYLAPIAQVNGHTYVAFAQGNQDGIGHFVTLANGTFGLEDLYGGGDRDFDDQVLGFSFKSVSTVV